MARTQIQLSSGELSVTLSNVGAALIQLRYRGESYCPERPESDLVKTYHGSVIAPWANRIADGRYTFEKTEYQLEVNERNLNTSLHGLSAGVEWDLIEVTPTNCTFALSVHPRNGYPWMLDLRAEYSLEKDGLNLVFQATNRSVSAAPFGWAFHPYFQLPDAPAETWLLELPAQEYVAVDERLLPTDTRSVEGRFDFRTPSPCCLQVLDHAFGNIHGEKCRARLSSSNGKALQIQWDKSSPWVQLHHPVADPKTLVIEPQSAPPNAFNSGVGLVVLGHGETFRSEVSVNVA